MENLDESKIKLEGKKQGEHWLTGNDYSNVSKETLHASEIALKASGKTENILVQVRTFVHPHRPFKLSDYEVDLLTRRASKLKSVAYIAYVILNKDLQLNEDIIWERLT